MHFGFGFIHICFTEKAHTKFTHNCLRNYSTLLILSLFRKDQIKFLLKKGSEREQICPLFTQKTKTDRLT